MSIETKTKTETLFSLLIQAKQQYLDAQVKYCLTFHIKEPLLTREKKRSEMLAHIQWVQLFSA